MICEYTDLYEYCDQLAETIVNVPAEFGGQMTMCDRHAQQLLEHIKTTKGDKI